MASVKLTNVKKIYGKDTVAVQDFNLDIADKADFTRGRGDKERIAERDGLVCVKHFKHCFFSACNHPYFINCISKYVIKL